MVCGMFVWCNLCVGVCMLTVLNALLMSSATVTVRSGVCFGCILVRWCCLCCVVLCLLLKHVAWRCVGCCVMYGSSVFSSVFAITERSEMGLYNVPVHVFVWFWNWNDVC